MESDSGLARIIHLKRPKCTGSPPEAHEGVEPMGRGRAKAKQTKVARELKYSTGGIDIDRLQDELAAERGTSYTTTSSNDDEEDDEENEDKYAEED
jgi:hypothetical protein